MAQSQALRRGEEGLLKRADAFTCRVCGSQELTLIRSSTISGDLHGSDFAITNFDYGITAAIYRCLDCGLLQCPVPADISNYYETLQDPEYEEGRHQRYLQAKHLVSELLRVLGRESGEGFKLLDVGAGSGVLVEASQKRGFEAVGVEPSTWFVHRAKERGLNIYQGVLPHPALEGTFFDVVTLIDVIEHVTEPLILLQTVRRYLKVGGIVMVVTPDVSAFLARMLGFKWWHYRVAHVSYFNRKTLQLAMEKAGLRFRSFGRPRWYFSYAYLRKRLLRYLPPWLLPPVVGPLKRAVVPLNLRDSLLIVSERT